MVDSFLELERVWKKPLNLGLVKAAQCGLPTVVEVTLSTMSGCFLGQNSDGTFVHTTVSDTGVDAHIWKLHCVAEDLHCAETRELTLLPEHFVVCLQNEASKKFVRILCDGSSECVYIDTQESDRITEELRKERKKKWKSGRSERHVIKRIDHRKLLECLSLACDSHSLADASQFIARHIFPGIYQFESVQFPHKLLCVSKHIITESDSAVGDLILKCDSLKLGQLCFDTLEWVLMRKGLPATASSLLLSSDVNPATGSSIMDQMCLDESKCEEKHCRSGRRPVLEWVTPLPIASAEAIETGELPPIPCVVRALDSDLYLRAEDLEADGSSGVGLISLRPVLDSTAIDSLTAGLCTREEATSVVWLLCFQKVTGKASDKTVAVVKLQSAKHHLFWKMNRRSEQRCTAKGGHLSKLSICKVEHLFGAHFAAANPNAFALRHTETGQFLVRKSKTSGSVVVLGRSKSKAKKKPKEQLLWTLCVDRLQ